MSLLNSVAISLIDRSDGMLFCRASDPACVSPRLVGLNLSWHRRFLGLRFFAHLPEVEPASRVITAHRTRAFLWAMQA